MHVALVIPVNFLFRVLWTCLGYIFDERTRGRVRLLADVAELQAFVAAGQLPRRLLGQDSWVFDPERDWDCGGDAAASAVRRLSMAKTPVCGEGGGGLPFR